jgi:hypothetical protein
MLQHHRATCSAAAGAQGTWPLGAHCTHVPSLPCGSNTATSSDGIADSVDQHRNAACLSKACEVNCAVEQRCPLDIVRRMHCAHLVRCSRSTYFTNCGSTVVVGSCSTTIHPEHCGSTQHIMAARVYGTAAAPTRYGAVGSGGCGAGQALAPPLQDKGWATGVTAGVSGSGYESNSCCSIFSIFVVLTDAGMEAGPGFGLGAMELVWQYLQMLREAGEMGEGGVLDRLTLCI